LVMACIVLSGHWVGQGGRARKEGKSLLIRRRKAALPPLSLHSPSPSQPRSNGDLPTGFSWAAPPSTPLGIFLHRSPSFSMTARTPTAKLSPLVGFSEANRAGVEDPRTA
jgi:hypothetical protein